MPHLRVTIEGGWTTNAEVWASGVAILVDGPPPSQAALDAYAQSVMNYLSSATADPQALRGTISTVGEIRRVRVYYYAAVGAPASLQAVSTAAASSGTGTAGLPLQCARVVTLLSGLPGASYRGRMYWPKVTTGISTSFTDTTVNQGFATAFATVLGVIGDTAPSTSPGQPAVVSEAKGVVTPVTSVRVGNIVDTQRRRRDALVETFFTAII